MLDDIAGRIILMEGWRRWGLALLAGVTASLALPPIGALPALMLGVPVLVWLIDGSEGVTRAARLRSAFGVGWAFGLGYLGASLYWITEAFLIEGDVFGWLAPLAVPLLAGGLGLFFGFGALLARLVWSDGPGRVAALALGLGASEWLRGHVLTGFPWNVPGLALAAHEGPAQGAALVGVHGLTVLALLLGGSLAALAPRRAGWTPATWGPPILALAGLAVLWVWGAQRPPAMVAETQATRVEGLADAGLRGVAPGTDDDETVWLRIVQPAIPQAEKWRGGNGEEILATYLDLSRAGPADDPAPRPLSEIDAVIWPESAFPFVLVEAPGALAAVTDLAAEGPVLLTGALRLDRSEAGAAGRPRAYNSLYAIGPRGIEAAYDKTHLVPFGEYLPWQSVLESLGLRQLAQMRGGFTAGRTRQALDVAGLPRVQPLICYEAIFPGTLFGPDTSGGDAPMEARPAWLLNVTNDAWFGTSIGPAQHLAHARLRAIEEGLPLVRAANTGISAVFDAYGRGIARLELGVIGALDAQLPPAIAPPPFARWGWGAPLVLLLLCAGLSLLGRYRRY
ncbi:MAG: apolipoprotein N-acyltransferase [Pseudomonadota bacterium]